MTLVLSCITREYAIQVSDRRLVRLSDGKPCKDDENKAVDFCGRMAFSYTGLANLSNTRKIPTDLWLAEAMLGSSSISEAVEAIRVKATGQVKKITAQRPEWKRLAFVGVGWIQLNVAEPLRPAICVISNFHDDKGDELDTPLEEFKSKIFVMQDNTSQDFIIVAIGQTVYRDVAQRLNRNVAGCVKHSYTTGPKSLLRLLVDAIRETASRKELEDNSSIGKDLLAVSVPRKAVETSFFTMPDGSKALFALFSPPLKSSRTFVYIPEGQNEGTAYGPNLVFGGTLLRGYFEVNSREIETRDISARIMKLEDGAKAGIIVLEGGSAGQFISRPIKTST